MTKIDQYRQTLRTLDDWDSFLLAESGLPGPRGNLELAQAVADEGDKALFQRWLAYDARKAPTNTSEEFLVFCGAVGLGRLLAEGHTDVLDILRQCANDSRWRIREGVATGLQRWGDVNMNALLDEMAKWSRGSLLEQRAAAAALCEPRLLHQPAQVHRVLDMLDRITASILKVDNRKSDEFKALKKGLAYCWSVAVAAYPEKGKVLMEKWLSSEDKDLRALMKDNLKKNRLVRMDAGWVERSLLRLSE